MDEERKSVENNNEWKNFLKKFTDKLEIFMKEIKSEWFFKALYNLFEKKEKELTEEEKKTQEQLNKFGTQLLSMDINNLNDSMIWNEIKIQNSLEQDLKNEETILWVLSKNKVVKEWFDWFTSWIDDWLNINGRTGKEIKADWFEFVLLAARNLADDNSDWKSDLSLDDLNKIWENLWKIKKSCEEIQTKSRKTKEQVLAVCAQKLKDKLKTNDYDMTKVDIIYDEVEEDLKKLDDVGGWWQSNNIEDPDDSKDE